MKNKLNLVIIGFIFLCFYLCNNIIIKGQTTFIKTYGKPGNIADRGYTVKQTSDGGFVAIGFTDFYSIPGPPHQEYGNIYLIKTDSLGKIEWEKTFGGDKRDVAYSMDLTNDGGFIISGYSHSYSNNSYGVLWLLNLDLNGDSIWTKTYPLGKGNCVISTHDSNYIITGCTDEGDNSDVFLLKINSSGNILWLKIYDFDSYRDEGFCLQQTADGGYIITGYAGVPPNSSQVFLIKTDSFGDTLWMKIYGKEKIDEGHSVNVVNDGGYFITGLTSKSGAYGLEIYGWLLKTNSLGDTTWTKEIRKSIFDVAISGIQTEDGDFIAVGETLLRNNYNTDIFITKLDNSGNTVWFNTLGNEEFTDFTALNLTETSDNGFIITGRKLFNLEFEDLLLIKLNYSGQITQFNEIKSYLPDDFKLYQNYSNPFNPSTTIKFTIPSVEDAKFASTTTKLVVYDILGREIATLVNEYLQPGNYEVEFNAKGLSSGVYYYRIESGNYSDTKKMILLK